MRVLIVDDSLPMRTLLVDLLEQSGTAVETAGSGEEALQKAASTSFGMILVDIEMPGMDGFATARALRKISISCPLIALSGHPTEQIRKQDRENIFTDYLSKSFDLVSLAKSLGSLLQAP